MRYFALGLILALAVPVFAETDYIAMPEIKKLKSRVTTLEDATNGGVSVTNVIVSGDSKTNTIIVLDGIVTSWTITE